MNIQEVRQAAFTEWAKLEGLRFEPYDGLPYVREEYDSRGTITKKAQEWWQCWNAALDSVVVELPEVETFGGGFWAESGLKEEDVHKAIIAAGVCYEVKS